MGEGVRMREERRSWWGRKRSSTHGRVMHSDLAHKFLLETYYVYKLPTLGETVPSKRHTQKFSSH